MTCSYLHLCTSQICESPSQVLYNIVVSSNISKFFGKHLWWSSNLINLQVISLEERHLVALKKNSEIFVTALFEDFLDFFRIYFIKNKSLISWNKKNRKGRKTDAYVVVVKEFPQFLLSTVNHLSAQKYMEHSYQNSLKQKWCT